MSTRTSHQIYSLQTLYLSQLRSRHIISTLPLIYCTLYTHHIRSTVYIQYIFLNSDIFTLYQHHLRSTHCKHITLDLQSTYNIFTSTQIYSPYIYITLDLHIVNTSHQIYSLQTFIFTTNQIYAHYIYITVDLLHIVNTSHQIYSLQTLYLPQLRSKHIIST